MSKPTHASSHKCLRTLKEKLFNGTPFRIARVRKAVSTIGTTLGWPSGTFFFTYFVFTCILCIEFHRPTGWFFFSLSENEIRNQSKVLLHIFRRWYVIAALRFHFKFYRQFFVCHLCVYSQKTPCFFVMYCKYLPLKHSNIWWRK